MKKSKGILDIDPRRPEMLQQAAAIIEKMVAGPDFEGKEVLKLLCQCNTIGDMIGATPEQMEAIFIKATRLMEAGNLKGARELMSLGVQLDPVEERFTYGLATTYQLEGNFLVAGRLFALYLSMDADCIHGRLRLGECLIGTQEYKGALEMFSSVLSEEEWETKFPKLVAYARDMKQRCERLMGGPLQ